MPSNFVIELARLETTFDGLGDQAHFVEVAMALGRGQFAEFGHVPSIDDDAIAAVELPGSEQHHGMRKLPDEFVGWQLIKVQQFVT